MSDLLYTEEEEALRSAVRSLLADRCDAATVLARTESEQPHDRELWKALADGMGLAGLLVPEDRGGQGATHREAAVVLEELGRAVAPVPYLTSAVVATETLLACTGEAAAELLAALASGRTVGALAVPFATAPGAALARVRYEGGALHGEVTGVADAAAADVLLVLSEAGLFAVDTGRNGVTVTPRTSLDRTRPLAVVTFDAAPARLLADAAEAEAAVRLGLRSGAGLLASEQLGLAEWCLTETVRYTKERHQFNRPVGSFQALKHRLAGLWLDVVNTRAAARHAADALATGSDEPNLAAALAQAYAAPVAVRAAEEALQLHGGIGMTWEHPVHLYLKRAKADSIALGTAGRHREELADLVDLQAPATP
ncbi:acyl-CoA dehydrogenase family protein [Streptomyces flavofungini]|uniref:Acyl-CoA/acyl-ACP dehydrogenase n=1 Tax=Streptomyces flavofungini TaxID=68200 RepID=A0ABS0X9X7_9ACTN|nr:acyl-CoA dehydrogenase family protein [Streptomyces flavofungini]MBJ3809779.1 acyl-CoA/acyl-ACP dehydrogenase [Streptomyces flavofungini]GHC80704.1 acyl-CoA dehydrogenase [Streptomyces flavofungini]